MCMFPAAGGQALDSLFAVIPRAPQATQVSGAGRFPHHRQPRLPRPLASLGVTEALYLGNATETRTGGYLLHLLLWANRP